MIKKILLTVIAVFIFTTAGVGAVSYSVKEFLTNIQVNTTQMPDRGWIRWQTAIFDKRGCVWVDFTRLPETPKAGWMRAWDFIQNIMIPTFGNPPLTPEQQKFCYGDWPAINYIVDKNGTYKTRPLYDGDLWLSTRDTGAVWKEIGRVEVGRECESTVIRKTTFNYRWTTNLAGVRGLTACTLQIP